MWRVSIAALGLAIACGPLVAVEGDSTEDGGPEGDDDRGDDRPGTGPAPTGTATSPTTLDDGDDGFPEGEVDDGWQPDFPGATQCSDAALYDCYDAYTFEGYEGEVLLVAVHDLGGDGVPEIVVVGEFWIAVHLGASGGWLEADTAPHALESPSALAFGDFVDDANVDIVAIQPPYGGLFVEAGNGEGEFYLPTFLETPGLPVILRVTDLDLDGTDEVVTTLADGPLVVAQSFDPPLIDIIEPPVWQTEALELGALGLGDGAYDLLVSGVSGDQVLLGLASYAGALANDWEVHPFVPMSVGLAARDFDGDGAIDIATASASDTLARLYRRSLRAELFVATSIELTDATLAAASGRFGPSALGLVAVIDGVPTIADFASDLATPLVGDFIDGPLSVLDMNADGMDDIVARSHDHTKVVVYLSHE